MPNTGNQTGDYGFSLAGIEKRRLTFKGNCDQLTLVIALKNTKQLLT